MSITQTQTNKLTAELEELVFKKNELTLANNLFLFTVNYKSAPVAIREKFAIPEYSLEETYKNLKRYKSLNSFLLLSTCNRTEIYFNTDNFKNAISEIYDFFTKNNSIEQKITKEYSLIIKSEDVIHHAFKLACGLDSLVMGESQILSQLKAAYSIAQKEGTLNYILETILQGAIRCAREIHKNTNLSKNCQSVSSAAVDLADKVAGPLKTKSVMVLGAGRMAELALEHIVKLGGSKETIVLNRSPHRIIEFSEKYKTGRSIAFENVYEAMNDVDIVITATGAPHFIIFAEQFKQVRKTFDRSLFIFDVSMPRNVDSEFGKLKNINLMDIDSLQHIYNKSLNTNSSDLHLSNEIISRNIKKLYKKLESDNLGPIIKTLKEKCEKIRTEKLSAYRGKTVSSEELEYLTKNIINTILHTPIKNLKQSSTGGSRSDKSELLKDLFGL